MKNDLTVLKKKPAWICLCRRKNSDENHSCVFCGNKKPEGKNHATTSFYSNASYPKVQRGDYECSKGSIYFRSKWEANYALYLDFLLSQKQIAKWEYENKTFVFDKVEFGVKRYLPDFEVTYKNGLVEYHEIKGYMDSRSKTKIKRMKKYYPDVTLILIEKSNYKEILKKLNGIVKFY